MFRFRPPWWMREYIKKKLNITAEDAEKTRFYLAATYAFTAFLTFNYVVYRARSPGIVSDEEEENLTAGEKVLIAMRPIASARIVKYKFGEGVVSDTSYTQEQVQESYNQVMEARKNLQDKQSQPEQSSEASNELFK